MTSVIVVDDNAMVRRTARVLLEAAGFQVAEVEDGEAALRLAVSQRPDLVLCDLFMPGLDGLEVLQALRRDCPTAKVIAMSGGGFNGTVDLLPVARQLGASAILEKPFTQQTLLVAVAEALGPSASDEDAPSDS